VNYDVNVDSQVGQFLHVVVNGKGGCGGHLWDAAQHLVCWLDQSSHPIATALWSNAKSNESLRVLDVGSGTGLCGIYAARRGARTILSDLPVMVPVMNANLVANGFPTHQNEDNTLINAMVLEWGKEGVERFLSKLSGLRPWCESLLCPAERASPPFDVILVSDCVYLEATFVPLLLTLISLTYLPFLNEEKDVGKFLQNSSEKEDNSKTFLREQIVKDWPIILMAYQKRRKAEKRFFTQLKKYFTVEILSKAELNDVRMRQSKVQLLLIRPHHKISRGNLYNMMNSNSE
jgi:protein N-lysine methyltransferase METTL21A